MSRAAQALIMAGGTGGHIFPGLAVAQGLKQRGWQVHWLGGEPPSMESDLVPKAGFEYHPLNFKGVRGKGFMRMLTAPFALVKALASSLQLIRSIKPQVLLHEGDTHHLGQCVFIQTHPIALFGFSQRIETGAMDWQPFEACIHPSPSTPGSLRRQERRTKAVGRGWKFGRQGFE